MAFLIGGIFIALGLILLGRGVLKMDMASLKRAAKWLALTVFALLLVWLVATGRLGSALATLGALVAMFFRWGGLLAQLARLFGVFQQQHRAKTAGWGGINDPQPATGTTSSVESDFLSMTLDHDTARMDGIVRKGAFAGRMLGALGLDDLLKLYAECATDANSLRLMEAYLDRRFQADWRKATQSAPDTKSPDGPMSRAEALAELGLTEGATEAQIREAYRRRMRQVHPDHGGTDAQAARVNRARDVLLGA